MAKTPKQPKEPLLADIHLKQISKEKDKEHERKDWENKHRKGPL